MQLCSADMEFTGDPCSPTAPAVPEQEAKDQKDKPQECAAAGAGQSFCIKPNGDHCYTASSGRQICWQPGETGQKTDADVAQKRDAGNQPIPPNLQLPNGDTLQQTGTPTTTTTTQTQNGTTKVIVTTTTNYKTANGTNAGTGGDKGEPGDGTGDGSKNGASGGGNCETPPVVTGDAALNMVANQAWATRCAVEAGNAAKVTGDIANCAQPFTVEGTNANAVKLRAMRRDICPGEAGGMPGESEVIGEEGSREGLFASPGPEGPPGSDGLDDSGYGYTRGCPANPTVSVLGQSITFDLGPACEWAQLGGVFVLMLAGIVCLRIIGGA